MKIKQLATLVTGVLMFAMVSCEYVTIQPKAVITPASVSFATDVAPIFTALNCVQCHPALHAPDLSPAKAYSSLISNNLVNKDDPAASTLMQIINSGHNTAVNMTPTQKALILQWITEGAKNN